MDKGTRTLCAIEDCDRVAKTRGWCDRHYQRWSKNGDPLAGGPYRTSRKPREDCSVEGCARPHESRGYCGTHYRRWRIHGDAGTADLLAKPYDPTLTEKQCTGCGEVKPLSEYHRVSRRGQYVARCKPCRNDEIRAIQLRSRYGLSRQEYEAMVASQNGACAVCGSTHRLCVDHNHTTGAVRKILCDSCNVALGRVGEDPSRLRALADYIEAHA